MAPVMRTILCLQHFRAADPLRQAEIDRCLAHNLRHPALAEAVVWVEPGAPPPPSGTVPTQFRPLARRLRFADWLRLARESDDAIVVLANADISLEGGFERLEPLLREPEVALALTRREAAAAGREPQLAADPRIDGLLDSIASFHGAVSAAAGADGGVELGRSRRERYVFTRRTMLAAMSLMAGLVERGADLSMAAREALELTYLQRVQPGPDRQAVRSALRTAGLA